VNDLLQGVRVLDFGRYVAGPFCSMLLGELGAEVIRIEKVDGAEDRHLCPIGGDDEVGAMYLQLNRNKRCLTLNPLRSQGREIVRKLVATADVVVANLPDATLSAMGLDYAGICAIKPGIILAKASAYGSKGPYRDKTGFDGTGQAMSGAMHLSGYGHEPMRTYPSWVDNGTAMSLAFGIMAALLHREKTGEGQLVEGSLLGTSLAFMADALIEQQVMGVDRHPTANRSQKGAPSDAFRSRDGKWIMIQIMGPAMFKRWAALMGEEHWLTDPRFVDDTARAAHAELLSARTGKWCSERDATQLIAELEAASIPCAPIYSPAEALADPQIRTGGFMLESTYPGIHGNVPLVAAPIRFSTITLGMRRRAPRLGEHTDDILADLGLSPDEVRQLKELRIV
jgi:crotonobetainyl-CoA:carnitine CoA-transferase CaiB-like acyl-CoA transferase